MEALAKAGVFYGTDNLATFLKSLSSTARKAWLEGRLLPDTNIIGRILNTDLATFGYLGRSLPCKPRHLVEEDVKQAVLRFTGETNFKIGRPAINVAQNLINKWTRLTMTQLNIETPPYSESASIITPRMAGGQANFFRDIYQLLEVTTRGPTRKKYNGAHLRTGVHSEYDFMCDFTWYEGGVDPKDRGSITRTISEFVHFLDYPFLKHIKECSSPCSNPDFHFPFVMCGIPETGWRTRCASLPWPSLVFMTELPRRAIIRGTKKDPLAGSALTNFRDLPLIKGKDFINSSDLASATDYLPLDVQFLMGNTIRRHWEGTLYEKYITASFSSQRMCDDVFAKWPGIDYFLPFERHQTVRSLTNERFLTERSRQLALRRYARFGLKPEMSVMTGKEPIVIPASEEIQSNRTFREFVKEGTTVRPQTGMETHVKQQQLIDKGKRKMTLAELDHEQCLELLASVRDWYRSTFTCTKGVLTKRGQHMSLPLSWVVLSALNNACAIIGKLDDPGAVVFTMGDDSVFAADNMNAILRYQSTLRATGFQINYSKDAISRVGRAVFCEHLIDGRTKDIWVDKPRSKLITQPSNDRKSIHWLSLKESPPKWYTSAMKQCIFELRVAHYHKELKTAIRYGFDPSLPPQFGGFGMTDFRTKNSLYYRMKLSHIEPKADSIIRLDKEIQKVILLNPPYSSSDFLWSKLVDLKCFFVNGRSPGYTNEEVNDLLISEILPSLIYQAGFKREDYTRKSPAEIGQRLQDYYRNLVGSVPGQMTTSDLLLLRRNVRYQSWYLDYLEEMKLDNLRFWKR
jgi:hypothetical protein